MTTVIQKWGNSQGIRLPKYMMDIVKWNEGEEIEITAENGRIIIEKANPRKTITELFADYQGEYTPEEIDWGEPAGGEIW